MCGPSQAHRVEDHHGAEVSLLQQALAERLHDGPLQDLVALQLKAANLARPGRSSAAERIDGLVEVGNLAQVAIDHLHQIIRELTAEAAEPLELFPRLVELCDQFRAESGMACDVHIEREHTRFVPAVSDVLYRTVRELLTNVRKHSQATLVKLATSLRHDGTVAISVVDNGIGLPTLSRRTNPFQGGGFGLWSIEHRLGEFGAFLEIEDDSGLRVTIVVPQRLLAQS